MKTLDNPTRKFVLAVTCCLAGAALLATTARATDFTWNGATGTNTWALNSQWLPNTSYPGFSGSTDNIMGASSDNPQGLRTGASSRTVNNFSYSGTGAWQVVIDNSGTLTISGTLSRNATAGTGVFSFRRNTGATNVVLNVGTINVSSGGLDLGVAFGNGANLLDTLVVNGNTTVSGGALRMNVVNDYSLGLLTLTSGSVALHASATNTLMNATVSGVTGTGGGVISADARTTASDSDQANLIVNTTGTYSTDAVLINGGNSSSRLSVTKSGAGTQTFTGSSTYSGGTTVSAGTLLVNNTAGSGLGTGSVTVNGGKLGGTGSFSGTVTVNSGGTLSPGASIETLGSGALSMNNGSTFEYQVNSAVALSVGADLQKVTGALSLSGTVALTLSDIAGSPTAFALGTTFSLINYSGAWNGGLFTIGGNAVADDGTFTMGLNTWQLDYNAVTGGSNFAGEYAGGNFVNITAVTVPEPGTFVLSVVGLGFIAFRTRRRSAAAGSKS